MTPDGRPYALPGIALTRGPERIALRPDGRTIYLLRGNGASRDLVMLDLGTGDERLLAALAGQMTIVGFDVSPDGTEVVLERRTESADQLLIELGASGPDSLQKSGRRCRARERMKPAARTLNSGRPAP